MVKFWEVFFGVMGDICEQKQNSCNLPRAMAQQCGSNASNLSLDKFGWYYVGGQNFRDKIWRVST